jgi:hypothetical protein
MLEILIIHTEAYVGISENVIIKYIKSYVY